MRKQHAAGQGIVASENLDTIYQREIFFPVDPQTLDWMDYDEVLKLAPSGFYTELDIEPFLDYLPELEAEIFWLVFNKKKHQKDIAVLLDISQPTVSYRFRRVLTKLHYLMTLQRIPIRDLVEEFPFLQLHEKEILHDLFYYLNQEMVGKKHNVRQSTVKWIFTKSMTKLEALERQEPERWCYHFGILLLLDHNFQIRIQH